MIRMLWETLRLARSAGAEQPLSGLTGSRLRYSLQLADHPSICAGRHEHYKVHNDFLVMDDFSAIRDAQFVLRGIVQLHDIALGGVKHGFHPVILVYILLAEAGVLLADNRIPQHPLSLPREGPFKGIQGA